MSSRLRAAVLERWAPRLAAKLGVPQHVRYFEPHPLVDLSAEDLAQNAGLLESFHGYPARGPKSLVWLVPAVDGAYGGVKTIRRLAEALETRHGIQSHFGIIHLARGRSSQEVLAMPGVAQFPRERLSLVTKASDLQSLPSADAGIATSWATAHGLARFNRVRMKYYFLQDYEPGFHDVGVDWALARETYRLGFRGVFNTPGLSQKLSRHFARSTFLHLPFDPAPRPDALEKKPPNGAIVVYGRPSMSRNGFLLASAALRKVHAALPNVPIYSFGEDWEPEAFGLVGIVKNLGFAAAEEVEKVLDQASVGLSITLTPSPSLATLQMMDHGVAVVTTDNAWTDWLLQDGKNCVKVRPFPSLIADAILQLLNDPGRRNELARMGMGSSAVCNYADSADRLQRFLGES